MDKYMEEFEILKKHAKALKLQEKKNHKNLKLPSIDPIDVANRKYSVVVRFSDLLSLKPISVVAIFCEWRKNFSNT